MELWWEDYDEPFMDILNLDLIDLHKAQLAMAVEKNDVNELKLLLSSKGGIDLVDFKKNTLLHYAVKCDKIAILDVLLETDGTLIDVENEDLQETALLLAVRLASEAIVIRLLEKGADVNLVDCSGTSPLHHAIMARDSPAISKLLIEKGANINCRNLYGATPLLTACRVNSIETVSMLLCYGADVTIPTVTGYPPFMTASDEIQDILFDYVFDGDKIPLLLNIVTRAMATDSPLLEKLFANISEIYYYKKDLYLIADQIFIMNPQYFKLFVQNFEHAAKKIISHASIFSGFLTSVAAGRRAIENMQTLLNSPLASSVTDSINMCLSPSCFDNGEFITIGDFVDGFSRLDASLHDTLLEITSQLLSEGAQFDYFSIGTVYTIYGFNSLFKQMITMDIAREHQKKLTHLMPRLIVDVKTTPEDILTENQQYYALLHVEFALDHFCHQQLKDICLRMDKKMVTEKVEKLPRVPLLLELARNVARKHIINLYNVETFKQLCEVLHRLPITKQDEQILTYERKVYG